MNKKDNILCGVANVVMEHTINREASDKTKGFRLQKIRAIELMIDTITENSASVFYTAIENVEDVSHTTFKDGQQQDYYEEDKNFASDGNFTIFSPQVLNTLVSFFDVYINAYRGSSKLRLGFYTTKDTGKEQKRKLKNGTEITLPSEPILNKLSNIENCQPEVIALVKDILIEEYTKQYKGKTASGHLGTLESISLNDFTQFLSLIRWRFGQEDDEQLKKSVLTKITQSPLFNVNHLNKQNLIFAALMEKLDEKQNTDNFIDKAVHSSDVKLIFNEIESQQSELSLDPTWKEITQLELSIKDKRNLNEKFKSIINDYPPEKLAHLARKACRSKTEQFEQDKTFLSLKYRIYEACNDYFFSPSYASPVSAIELDNTVTAMTNNAITAISKLKNDYKYSVSNDVLIEGIVYDLFDSCFLAFNECDYE